jgi:hypothetical protein
MATDSTGMQVFALRIKAIAGIEIDGNAPGLKMARPGGCPGWPGVAEIGIGGRQS